MDSLPLTNSDSISSGAHEYDVSKIVIFIVLIPDLTITSNFLKRNTFQNFKAKLICNFFYYFFVCAFLTTCNIIT